MKAKKTLLVTTVTLLLSIGVFATVMFAWLSQSNVTSDFVLETGEIHTKATLSRGIKGGEAYDWTEVVTGTDASKIFAAIIPGQIVTLKLEIENLDKSNVDVTYTVSFGTLSLGVKSTAAGSSGITYTPVTSALEADAQHFFNAINVVVEQVDNDNLATVSAVEIADSDSFEPVVAAKKLSEYVTNSNLVNSSTPLSPGSSVTYIIKLYFDPTFGDPDSNEFAKNAFKVENLTIYAEQVHKITD